MKSTDTAAVRLPPSQFFDIVKHHLIPTGASVPARIIKPQSAAVW